LQRSLDFDLIVYLVVSGFTEHYYNINRENNINMGGNGEDTPFNTARRIYMPKGSQEYVRIYQIRGGSWRQIQTSTSVGKTQRAAFEFSRIFKCFKGITYN
jgi:hypothetical protein